MVSTEEYLFVYGTLRKSSRQGGQNHHPMHRALCASADYLCDGHCPGKLYNIGHYPGLIPDPSGKALVQGEIYRVHNPQRLWRVLDAYENFNPADPANSDYIRAKTTVTTAGHGDIVSWVYHYNLSVKGLQHIVSGDYCQQMPATFPENISE